MKKKYTIIYLFIVSILGFNDSMAQCTPTFNDGCSIALHSFGLRYNPTSTILIEDSETACSGPSSSDVINVTAGFTYNFDLSVFSTAGSDNTSAFFSIWLDKNNDGDFEDADERLYYNNSTEIFKEGFDVPDFFSDVLTIPADATTGVDLKFRVLVVAANDLGSSCNIDPSDACGTYCGGEIHDYTFNIAPPLICPLTFINGCSIALHSFSLASVTPAITLINSLETACSSPESTTAINVKAGENYNFDLTVYSAGGSDNTSAFFSIWLDKNNDGDFADTGERLYYNNTTEIYKLGYGPPENASGSITIPNDALTGTDLKFRVLVVAANSLGDGCNTDPDNACGLYCGGEVHDYLLNIAPPECNTPNIPTVSDITACAGSNITLTASCASGAANWYDSSTAVVALGSGSFAINNVSAPGASYYVSCEISETCASNRVVQSTIVSEIPSPPTATGQTICSGTTASLTATCSTGTARWYESNTSTTLLATGSYTTPNLTNSTTYFVACESGGVPNCVSTRTAQIVTVNNLPSPPTATGQTICSGTTASLTATCSAGTAKWYESNTSTTVLATGSYTTPNLTNSTTYYVACESGGVPNCVSSRTSQIVTINDLPSPPTATGQTICSGTTASLTATCSTGTAKWYESNTSTTVLATGSYTTPNLTNSTTYYIACESGGLPNCVSSRTSQIVTINDLPSPPTATGQTICSGTTASLTATCSTGAAKWYESNTSTTVLATGSYTTPNLTNSTTYYVACESGGVPNCVSTRTSQIVTVNNLPSPPTATGQTICSGTTASLTATCLTGTAKWYESNTSTTVLATGSYTTPNLANSTTYYVACESGGVPNCVSARTAQIVTVNNLPIQPTATGQTICSGTTASLTATCLTGTPKWYESNTSTTVLATGSYITPNLTNSTTYYIACESGGVPNCVSSRTSQIVTVNDLPSPPTATGQTICSGTNASLTATCLTGTAKWYESSTSTTVLASGSYTTPNLTNSTTYYIACESGSVPNCVSARTAQNIAISPLPTIPVISANKTSLCNVESATLSATGCNGTIRWNTSATGSNLIVSLAGTYSAVCINNCGTSQPSNIVVITTGSTPSAPAVTSNKTIMCDGERATITASGCSGQISWNTGATTSSIELSVSGTFRATCTNFCGESAISNLITLRTGVSPTNPTIALASPILCGETSKTLIATGCNGVIKWSTNSTGSTLTVSTAGTYTAVCETLCGVSPRGNVLNIQFLSNPSPTATNTGPYEIGQKIQLSATGGSTYIWRGPNDFLSTNANISILNAGLADRGIYTITVTNITGCTATATTNVVVNPCSQMFKYDYVKAGDNFEYFFPITDGMIINAMSINTGIIVTPICQLDTINTPSVRIQMTGPEPLYNRDIIENIYPYSPFENRWFHIFGPIFPVGEYTLTVTGYSQEYAQGNIMFGPQTIHFTIVGNSTSITMAQPNIAELCAGSSFNVNFETTESFLNENVFEVQLSDANGSFEIPIKIGESTSAGVVNCQIPANIPAGSGYKIRVFSTKPSQMSNSSSSGFKVNPRNMTLQSPNDDISVFINKKAGEKITATNKIQTGGNATFQAGRSINLDAGFSVNAGSVFKAEIGGCN